MHTSPKPWILMLALALTLAPMTALASNHAQDEQSPKAAFEDIVDAMGEGQPGSAEATYQQSFAPQADNAPTAAEAIDSAFSDLEEAQPDTPAYAYASQIAKKGVLAVSYETIKAAAETGDIDAAQAYFQVLATKFASPEQLADSKQAFDTIDEDSLPETVATLETEYTDLIAAKVYAETEETPELLEAGDQTTAAKEAGEALGYALSLHASVEQILDAQSANTLADELEGLGEHTLAAEEQATRAEAEEILTLLATYSLATAPEEKLNARASYDRAIAEERFDQAANVYEDAFAEHASSYATNTHEQIQAVLDEAQQASGNDLAVDKQILEKSLLTVAWNIGFHELAEEEIEEGVAYLVILADKFDSLEDPGDLGLHLGHIAASNSVLGVHEDGLRDTLTDRIVDKVYEEIDEVFINWNETATAQEKAIEAVVYYQPIHQQVATRLSQEEAEHLDSELRGLYNATTEGNREEAEREAGEARELLVSFTNAGGDVSALDQTLQSLERTLSIITVEIEEYFEYKEQGEDAKAQQEVEESKAFISKALATFEDEREALADADEQAALDVEENMEEIQSLLETEADLDAIPGLVEETIEKLSAFQQPTATGPAVDLRLDQPAPADGEAFRVPVRLVNLSEGGYSLQATITFDESELTVERVEIPAQVGAETISPGEVRFNAASVGEQGTEPIVAELYVVPAAVDGEPELSVDIETLTDGEGDPLTVGNITGERLQLASESNAAQASDPVPLGGVGLVGLATISAALAARRRS